TRALSTNRPPHPAYTISLAWTEIVRLGRIGLQVVQRPVTAAKWRFNEEDLPVAHAQCAAFPQRPGQRFGGWMDKVLFPRQEGDHGSAPGGQDGTTFVSGRWLDASDVQDRRGDIDDMRQHVVRLARPFHPWATDDQGCANTTFSDKAFIEPEGPGAGLRPTGTLHGESVGVAKILQPVIVV